MPPQTPVASLGMEVACGYLADVLAAEAAIDAAPLRVPSGAPAGVALTRQLHAWAADEFGAASIASGRPWVA